MTKSAMVVFLLKRRVISVFCPELNLYHTSRNSPVSRHSGLGVGPPVALKVKLSKMYSKVLASSRLCTQAESGSMHKSFAGGTGGGVRLRITVPAPAPESDQPPRDNR